jgi:hypothetical protein
MIKVLGVINLLIMIHIIQVSYLFLGPYLRLRICDAALVQEILGAHSYTFEKPGVSPL